ncbi:MAG: thioredoxin family protein [Ignavibacteria bacterium]|jgi:hypothetical protein|nr:thioredoxin family protein [Ignavibacteria bacterium]
MKLKEYITTIILILVAAQIYSNAATIKGRILDLQNKPFVNAGIISVCTMPDGSQEIKRYPVDKKGNYNIKIDYNGFMQLIFGVDTVDKLAIPLFLNAKDNIRLDMKMPHTKFPYVPLDSVIFASNIKDLPDKIMLVDSIFNSANLLSVYFRGYTNKNIDSNKFIYNIANELNNFNHYFEKIPDKDFRFITTSAYINSLECIRATGNDSLLNRNIFQYYIDNYDFSTPYLQSMIINFDNIAAFMPDEYYSEYLQNLAIKHSSKFIRSEVLASAVAYYFDIKKDKNNSAIFYNQLYSQFPTSETTYIASLKYDPKKNIQVGKQLPPFNIQSAEDKTIHFSKEFFVGKFLLLHFWNTETDGIYDYINNIAVARDKFFDDNIEFLSISFDDDPRKLTNFRLHSLPMKWFHSIDTKGMKSNTANVFEIYKTPFLMLISPDGTILALDDDLRGNKLIPTITKFLQ